MKRHLRPDETAELTPEELLMGAKFSFAYECRYKCFPDGDEPQEIQRIQALSHPNHPSARMRIDYEKVGDIVKCTFFAEFPDPLPTGIEGVAVDRQTAEALVHREGNIEFSGSAVNLPIEGQEAAFAKHFNIEVTAAAPTHIAFDDLESIREVNTLLTACYRLDHQPRIPRIPGPMGI